MELHRIESLIEKYLEGETTLAEEKELREYFATHSNLPAELEVYRMMFSYYQAEQEVTYEGEILLPAPRSYKWLKTLGGIAAVLAVLWFMQPFGQEPVQKNHSGTAKSNARSLFMMMGSMPEDSKENLEYINELNALNIVKNKKEESRKDTMELKDSTKFKKDNHIKKDKK